MEKWKFKILYDKECPFCNREVNWLERRNHERYLAFEDISASSFDPRTYGLTNEQVNARLYGVLRDGTVISGLDVTRTAFRTIGYGWLVAPTEWPGSRLLFNSMYLLFARYRVRLGNLIGRKCSTGSCKSS